MVSHLFWRGLRLHQYNKQSDDLDMLAESDFSKGIRGKYVRRFDEGTSVVALAPDVAELFLNSESVNAGLRAIAKIAHKQAEYA